MSKINILSSKIYNRISAGEVVERPFSVVKELVENSIDAGATDIRIAIERGGVAAIRITDNGCGIERSELKKAIMPHATSKIATLKDLDGIATLGFRGEALASIASVSKLTIVSKTAEDENGAILYTEGGEDVAVSDHPSVTGTEITVNNLFFNTPAREKFLKSDKSEESEITATVARFILGNPDIAFIYTADGKTVYQSFGDGAESAFISVYGVNTVKDCFYIDTEKNGVKIKGYIGKHYFTKPNRTYQSVFLNGRFIVNSTVSVAIANAYSAYTMKRQYPFYSLALSIPIDAVDVNVHPNKTDVRFSNNQIIYGALYSVVSKVLDGTSEVLDIVDAKDKIGKEVKENTDKIKHDYVTYNDTGRDYATHNDLLKAAKKQDFSFNRVVFRDSGKKADIPFKETDSAKTEEVADIFAENKAYLEKLEREKKAGTSGGNAAYGEYTVFVKKPEQTEIKIERELNYIGQALNTFLIFDDGEDMYFIDQHAAHERILFDKFTEQVKRNGVDTQILMLPYTFEVSPAEADFLLKNLPLINAMGVEIEEFGDRTFKVSAIPVVLGDMDLKEFFDGILSDLTSIKSGEIADILKEKIAQKACKAAIKSGDKLDDEDIKYILTAIKADLGLKCPHGRPIAVRVTRTEIDKWFKRIV